MAALTPDKTAEAYDRWFDAPWGRCAFSIERSALSNALGALRDALVLDAGCGTGRVVETFVAAGARVVGLDIDHLSPAIDAALEAIGPHGLEVEVGSMSSTITGPSEAVFAALADGFAAAASGHCVLVATISNACPQPSTKGGQP